jgi:hypothetical protein
VLILRIDRDKKQGDVYEAKHRISFCLDQFEKAEKFRGNLDWNSDIVQSCTIEEMLGALVSAEQVIDKEIKDE